MTGWHLRAQSRRAGALLGAVAVLVAGCTAAGGGSGPRADRAGAARHFVAASPPAAFSPTGPPRGADPAASSTAAGRGFGGAPARAACAPPLGNRPSDASRLRVAVRACWCCRWCACAWACCGCGPGRWPPRWWPRSHLAWQCCTRWLGPPVGDGSPIWPACGPGCAPRACPVGPARSAAGSVQARSWAAQRLA
jgi:hypothetical protein